MIIKEIIKNEIEEQLGYEIEQNEFEYYMEWIYAHIEYYKKNNKKITFDDIRKTIEECSDSDRNKCDCCGKYYEDCEWLKNPNGELFCQKCVATYGTSYFCD